MFAPLYPAFTSSPSTTSKGSALTNTIGDAFGRLLDFGSRIGVQAGVDALNKQLGLTNETKDRANTGINPPVQQVQSPTAAPQPDWQRLGIIAFIGVAVLIVLASVLRK
jgi:hypothetical protein